MTIGERKKEVDIIFYKNNTLVTFTVNKKFEGKQGRDRPN